MKNWVTQTAGWLAVVIGVVGGIVGFVDDDSAALLVTNGMGYIGIDRKFRRMESYSKV